MPLDPDVFQMVADCLDVSYVGVDGKPLPLRFFTAADCRGADKLGRMPYGKILAAAIGEIEEVMTVGELIAHEGAARQVCPRCDFESSLREIVYSGEFILANYPADHPGLLNEKEKAILAACREWAADDTIERCNEEA